jgi:alpha-1,3-glucosyltransferase
MALYYAPAFFFFLLALSLQKKTWSQSILSVANLGATVILSTMACLLPFSLSLDSIRHVVTRVFPFSRGLFEDKVANFWCVSGFLFKWHLKFPSALLLKFSLVLTVASLIPNGFLVLTHHGLSLETFLLSLTTSSLGFFLFSYQVHEKTIIFVILPLVFLCKRHPMFVSIMSYIASFR